MKRKYFLLIALISFSFLKAQNSTDALRYSIENIHGTARFNALSGAFGALGGDLSAIGINPAGSSVFLQNTVAVTLSVHNQQNDIFYFNSSTSQGYTDIDVNNAGGVWVLDMYDENSNWKKIALAINYNSNSNFDNELNAIGNSNNTIGDYFLTQAQGVALDFLELRNGESISDLYAYLGETQGVASQNAFLGYQGYLFDPVENTSDNTAYTSNLGTGSYSQDYKLLSRGFKGKYSFNLSTQYTDRLFFGINFNGHTIDYRQGTFLSERNSNSNSKIKRIDFENNLSVLGNGFSMQLGAIVKVDDKIRLGITYDTPTWYTISEETSQFLETDRIENNETITTTINPLIINVFNDYKLTTPGKIAGSAAYIFGKKGLISLDYSFKDFSSITFKPLSNSHFQSQNEIIANSLKGSSSLKIGGEYRIQQFSLRGGVNYAESPYKDKNILGDHRGFSLGLGYNMGNYALDFSYNRGEQKSTQLLYGSNYSNSYFLTTTTNNFLITLGFNL
ncbi:MAG: outer membrane protein transport protein [Flavobacteriaceae bacterium]